MTYAENLRGKLIAALSQEEARKERHLFNELNPDIAYPPILKAPVKTPKPASVLVPIVLRPEGPRVVFTVRPTTMPSHPGEICFPGGGPKAPDKSPVDTALREAEEEIGVCRSDMDVVGVLGPHFGGLGFVVTPVVALIQENTSLSPCDREVDDIFDVPFAALINRKRHIIETRERNNISYRMFAFPYAEGAPPRHIWGLTAGIMDTLAKAIDSDAVTL